MLSSTGIPEQVLIQPGTPASQATMSGYALVVGEFIQFKFRAVNYASGNVTVDVDWFSRSAVTANNCNLTAQLAAITANTDTGAANAKSYATANNTQTTVPGTGAGRLLRTSITVSNLDSIAQDDFVQLKVARATQTSGTDMVGDAVVVLVSVTYLSV